MFSNLSLNKLLKVIHFCLPFIISNVILNFAFEILFFLTSFLSHPTYFFSSCLSTSSLNTHKHTQRDLLK